MRCGPPARQECPPFSRIRDRTGPSPQLGLDSLEANCETATLSDDASTRQVQRYVSASLANTSRSQALAWVHSSSMVRLDTPRASAISSMVIPPKNRNSTT
jgi:hypothetical protein